MSRSAAAIVELRKQNAILIERPLADRVSPIPSLSREEAGPASFLPPIHPDELIFSFLARYQLHLGLGLRSFNRLVIGRARGTLPLDLPCRLGAIANAFQNPKITAQYLALNHTMLPYVTAYQAPAVRLHLMAAMEGDQGHVTYNIRKDLLARPHHLRFCPSCHEDMLLNLGELYWRRTHQLPIVTICDTHEEPLRKSLVNRAENLSDYVTPSAENCPTDGPSVLDEWPHADRACLWELTVTASRLLTDTGWDDDRTHAIEELVSVLRNKGYADSADGIEWGKLRPAVDEVLSSLTDVFPEVAVTKKTSPAVPWWLPHCRSTYHDTSSTMVILAERIVAAAVPMRRAFQAGPWPCMNPASDHFKSMTISAPKQVRWRRGRYTAVLECDCGYSYSIAEMPDGTLTAPRFRRFGPMLADVIRHAEARCERIEQTAASLGMKKPVLRNAMKAEGIETDWGSQDVGWATPAAGLTPRQRQSLELLAKGESIQAVALALKIDPKSVVAHRMMAKRRLGLKSSAELSDYVRAIMNDERT